MLPELGPIVFTYFVQKTLNIVTTQLGEFAASVRESGAQDSSPNDERRLPSVCLVGLGRCGSNIALGVSALVLEANVQLRRQIEAQQPADPQINATVINSYVKSFFGEVLDYVKNLSNKSEQARPLFLSEPVVIIGDLDQNLPDRVRLSKDDYRDLIKNYKKLKVLDLSDVHTSGAGHHPIVGQYLARLILGRNTEHTDPAWKHAHSYMIDSAGMRDNQSKLFFYIFSGGGGTGSGMASEFGCAQQYAIKSRHSAALESDGTPSAGETFEPIFSCGIVILPNGTTEEPPKLQAIHANAGRVICKYLADEYRYGRILDDVKTPPRQVRIHPFNILILISNDIMKFASGGLETPSIDMKSMERYANRYVAQQIFNILTAQSPAKDHTKSFFEAAGIDIGDTIQLDASDLTFSLSGPVAVAYAESTITQKGGKTDSVDMNDLLKRSVSLPHYNSNTKAIEGISVLPSIASKYKDLTENRPPLEVFNTLSTIHLFARASSAVTIISVPTGCVLQFDDMLTLKKSLEILFPNVKLRRYSLVMGASQNLSLTILIGKSVTTTSESLTLLTHFLKQCLAKDESARKGSGIENAVASYLAQAIPDETPLSQLLSDTEDPQEIIESNWEDAKTTYEAKFKSFLPAPSGGSPSQVTFQQISSLMVTKKDVFAALNYIRRTLRHKGVQTQQMDLSTIAIDGE